MKMVTDYPVRRATAGPGLHFFGYYDVTPWDATRRYLLALAVGFQGRPQTPDDVVTIGVVDTADGDAWRPLATTLAWNWQMGCRLQWLPPAPDRLVIHNDRRDGRYVAVVRDAFTGAEEALLPLPVYALNPQGTQAVTLNFSRLARCRPGYGYVGVPDASEADPCPDDVGIWWMDLATGASELIVTLAGLAAFEHRRDMDGAEHWVNHLLWSPDGSRLIFLHRWRPAGARDWLTRLYTARPDGTDLCLVADDDLISHFDWRDPGHLLAWATVAGMGDHYYLFGDRAPTGAAGDPQPVGPDVLPCDGHCSYSPDRRWILTDEYPDAEDMRALLLYDTVADRRVDIGRFYSVPVDDEQCRCDLHPRWSRDGRQVCIDSTHEIGRQVYIVDVAEATAAG